LTQVSEQSASKRLTQALVELQCTVRCSLGLAARTWLSASILVRKNGAPSEDLMRGGLVRRVSSRRTRRPPSKTLSSIPICDDIYARVNEIVHRSRKPEEKRTSIQ